MSRADWTLARRAVLAAPYAWIVVFFLAPMALIAKISLSHPAEQRPPYEPVFSLDDGFTGAFDKLRSLSFDAYRGLAGDSLYLDSYFSSLAIAGVSTLIMLIIAYPFALAMARAPARTRPLLIGLAIAPFWTSFLIRVYAWIVLLKDEGLINHALLALRIIDTPLQIYATNGAVVDRHRLHLFAVHAAAALFRAGAPGSRAARGGGRSRRVADAGVPARDSAFIVARSRCRLALVFIPAVGEFVIPDLLGGSETLMIGPPCGTISSPIAIGRRPRRGDHSTAAVDRPASAI